MAGTEGWSRILHRKDERGVIVESRVFGPEDEVPEGFEAADYQPVYAPREDDQAPVEESVLTPWELPTAKGTWIGETNEAIEEAAEDAEPDEDTEEELDEGSPHEAREQAGDGELTEAEKEVDESLESDEDESDDEADEVDEGTPRQAREDDLTDAEEEQDAAVAESSSGDNVQPPPQGGPGSGKEAWAQYAAAKEVSVPDDAGRDDIIAAVEKAGHPV